MHFDREQALATLYRTVVRTKHQRTTSITRDMHHATGLQTRAAKKGPDRISQAPGSFDGRDDVGKKLL